MEFAGFETSDFEVFDVPGFDERMNAVKTQLSPKFEQLGRDLAPRLTEVLGIPMFAHVAKHARRTVNPPKDTWVAFSADKRGYKKHPHFELGAWRTHIFALFGVLYEAVDRVHFAERINVNAKPIVESLPTTYVWVPDHTNPEGIPARDVYVSRLKELATRITMARNGELLVGIQIPKPDAARLKSEEFEQTVMNCFTKMKPLFRMAVAEGVAK
jgi:uncharacterized protein YktB (UPF0637 family)